MCDKVRQMEVIDFYVKDGKVVPYQNDENVTLSDFWNGHDGSDACRIFYALNNYYRDRIIEKVGEYRNPLDKMDALKHHFLQDYNYDYDIVFGKESKRHEINIGRLKYLVPSITLREGFIDPDGGHDLNGKHKLQSPTAHILKRFQCVTAANEVARILRPNGIETDMVSSPSFCFDKFAGELREIPHVYNRVHLPSGKCVPYDICADIMSRDIDELCERQPKLRGLDKALMFDKHSGTERPFVL